ncbi:hypothetical protein PENARI_c086G03704 [Penicillium arizonense]|uniref:Uncharacterized protein n=1 Tax=Penicillium arizonense TaxID=1835702 RepID=A0A1F5L110_PENAI|nr:hypothetical protein PENARI_c086G03704 [Penicillium arizonense]OGE46938.1 hypothetical protein PENARI_c086G03704 [Penicillium arizonense]
MARICESRVGKKYLRQKRDRRKLNLEKSRTSTANFAEQMYAWK